ncbi:ABC transporter substrate-binding protein, partial [Tsukamurella sp. 8F]|uniref:ABC transporter substrate-binding protein n=1 Tax=Tsukamurella sp. 8F TaxID=3031961 RepID=UPI0023B8E0FE
GGGGPRGTTRRAGAYEGSGAAETMDPGVGPQFIDEARAKHVFDGLFEADSQMRPVARLAESAEADARGTRWRVRLRDARWHDGTALTADDVLYTLGRILGKQQTARPMIAKSTLSAVDASACRAVDARTVEIVLREPAFDLPSRLTAYGTRIVKKGATDFAHPVGTGAFRFERFTPGRELVVRRFDGHWGGAAAVDELRILSAGADARLAALRSGQIDFADDLSASAAATARGTAGRAVHATPNSGILYFAMKTQQAPFRDPDVRRAMMLLVDRDELVKVALEGAGEVGDDVFGRGYQYYASDLPAHRHDPDAAAALLRKAGVTSLRFELFVAPVANGLVEAARLFAKQARAAGVTVDVTEGSKDTYYTDYYKRGDMVVGQSGPLAIPYHFGSRLLTGASKNVTQWADPEFDASYRRAQAASSEQERAAIYHGMHETLHDRGGYIFWATTPWTVGYRAGLTGVPTGVPNSLDWARFDRTRA